MQICSKENCTGCGICAFECPQNCITMNENEWGICYPYIDENKCINCGVCKRICPQIEPVGERRPIRAYAAWSADREERRTSASGGIATEIYKYALENGYLCVGAAFQEDLSVKLEITGNKKELARFKNSKYVFSEAYEVFPEIKEQLNNGRKIVVIALPCQIAAIRSKFKDNENLVLIDVVCHGTTPKAYLSEHIKLLEKEYGKKASKVMFRDVQKGTDKFYFSLYDKDENCFYAKQTMHGDTYNFGYHRMVSYRENCYHCRYAKSSRVSDLTLSDYKGLGTMAPCDFTGKKVSSILINTKMGQSLIDMLMTNGMIKAYERPVEEPIQGDRQLQHPSEKGSMRAEFEKKMPKNAYSFEKTIHPIMRKYFRKEKIKKCKLMLSRIKNKIIKGVHHVR